ncbi:MAG: DUF6525 family protein [Paracoccaceae bacterium]|uniref:DUF6525 family protein n=1 Tax=Salipiger TaxID=263377 RepID=UPI0028800838|nr:DUF6525 family protein [Salipiger profundus]
MARITQRGNACSSLRDRTRIGDPMAAHDRFPPELRACLAEAAHLGLPARHGALGSAR